MNMNNPFFIEVFNVRDNRWCVFGRSKTLAAATKRGQGWCNGKQGRFDPYYRVTNTQTGEVHVNTQPEV